jgi:hypothetical protein
MGSKFCFFTDPALLSAQTAQQAFGFADAAAGMDRFRITSRHAPLSTATSPLPAYAICDGILCAQDDGPGTVTLILKPSQAPPFEAPVVSYFIYKGIDKASLLNGTDILDETAIGANDLTKRIAVEWKTLNNEMLTGSGVALGLDRDAAFVHVVGNTQTNVFTDSDPVERLFSYPHKTYALPTVAAGDLIGNFKTDAGLEIVLQRLGYKPALGVARNADNAISVVSLPGSGLWAADDYDFFAHWHGKEQVLAYLDPAAYFGAFVQASLYKVSGGPASKVDGDHVYAQILATFANRNVAWLDIRNNYSYSYNLFGLYGDNIQFGPLSGSGAPSVKNFRGGSWPLLKLAIADVPGSKRGALHRTKLSLPVGLSVAPAVLVSKGFVKGLGPQRPKFKAPAIALANAGDTFYTPLRLAFPATVENGQPIFTASYTRVNLYEKIHADPQSTAPLRIAGAEYLDGVFRLRDLQLDKDFGGNILRFEIYNEEVLVDLTDEEGPTYACQLGIAKDPNSVTLFAYPHNFLPNDNDLQDMQPVTGWADTADGSGNAFLSKLVETFRSAAVSKSTFQPDDLSHSIDAISVDTGSAHDFSVLTDRNVIDDYCLVVLDATEFDSLLSQISADPNVDTALPVFLSVSSSLTKRDAVSGVDYIEKVLQATAFKKVNGVKVAPAYVALTQRIYQNADS